MRIPKRLVNDLISAKKIVALTGAGISAESGIPTFREAQTGLWSKYDPQDLATPQAFKKNPKLVWDWYSWRRELISKSHPNPGHYALVELEKQTQSFTLITQNIDNLHSKAGSKNIVELHGNIFRTKCSIENTLVNKWDQPRSSPPRCPNCRGYLRPDVVWFNENLDPKILQAAVKAAENCDVFLSIGTSSLVYPAANLPIIASHNDCTLIEINPSSTPITSLMDYVLKGASGIVLQKLMECIIQ